MSDILHGKRVTTESFYEGELSNTKQEIIINIFSSKETLLKDMIEAMAVISSGETKKLNIEVCIDKLGRYRIVKKWVV